MCRGGAVALVLGTACLGGVALAHAGQASAAPPAVLAASAGAPVSPASSTPPVPSPDSQLDAGLAALQALPAGQPAPLAAPRAARGAVLPSQVLRWREEAKALEYGDNGLPRDPARAATLYCQAARYGDAEAQFALGWMLTNGRGIERDDARAAHMFAAAAEQGLPQAQRMVASLGTPLGEPPPCLRPPPPEPVPPPTDAAAATTTLRSAAARVGATPGVGVRPTLPLVRSPLSNQPPPTPLPANAPAPIVRFVQLVAPDYQLWPQLVLAIIATESSFNVNAVSPRQAQGLMQLIPDTAARFQVRDLMDPAQNIRGGMAYLRWLMAYFQGDVSLVAAAYNAGERAVERYRGVPPYLETQEYVRRIVTALGGYTQHPFDPRVTPPSEALALIKRR